MTSITEFVQFSEALTADRRQHRRYPLHLEGEYWLSRKAGIKNHGFGRTLDISSGGVLFEADDPWPFQGDVELLLEWPAVLEEVYPLKLRIRGTIVRTQGRSIAVDLRHYEFRIAESLPLRRAKSRGKINSDLRRKNRRIAERPERKTEAANNAQQSHATVPVGS